MDGENFDAPCSACTMAHLGELCSRRTWCSGSVSTGRARHQSSYGSGSEAPAQEAPESQFEKQFSGGTAGCFRRQGGFGIRPPVAVGAVCERYVCLQRHRPGLLLAGRRTLRCPL